jgi:F-type H+-transporting ATPase subunit gamma
VITSDTGLAGGFNSNLLKIAHKFVDDHRAGGEVHIEALGRKGRDYFRKRGYDIATEYVGVVDKPTIEKAREIATKMIDLYSKAEVDAVYIIVNEFKSVMAPSLVTRKILPVELPKAEAASIDYIFEQPPQEQLEVLLPRYVEMSIYRAMLESISAYHAARMTAMDAASSNAGDVMSDLTLHLNRVRQASITNEIIEIVSGAAAS